MTNPLALADELLDGMNTKPEALRLSNMKTLPNGDTESFDVYITDAVPEIVSALRLADELEAPIGTMTSYAAAHQAADELRRQWAEIEQHKQSLEQMQELYDLARSANVDLRVEIEALIRTQHAEIERLNTAIKWEQNRAERIGTHGPGCEKWGSAHYECLLRSVERKDALLRQALEALEFDMGKFAFSAYYAAREEAVGAITKELSQ